MAQFATLLEERVHRAELKVSRLGALGEPCRLPGEWFKFGRTHLRPCPLS